jgi:hypothetical protein
MLNRKGNSSKSLVALFFAFAAAFGAASSLYAQAVTGAEVQGYVNDPAGQAVVGAQVNMIEVGRDLPHTTVTDSIGHYALPNLPVGSYRLEVAANGFTKYVQNGITLEVANNVTIPVTMQIGSVNQNIEVTAAAAMVETKENTIAQVIERAYCRSAAERPQSGRSTQSCWGRDVNHDSQRRRPYGQQEHAGVERLGSVFRGGRAGERSQLSSGWRRS